ncbi:symplekin isoform X2, partial [Tanacetum coccineum]
MRKEARLCAPLSLTIFLANNGKYFAIFLRKIDIYVVGLQYWDGTIYEVGRFNEPGRYFYNSTVPGFGQQYIQLFYGSRGVLEGVLVGFHQFNKAILRIIVESNPLRWAWGIGIFALTFSESVRFIWFEEVISSLMEQEWNVPMEV